MENQGRVVLLRVVQQLLQGFVRAVLVNRAALPGAMLAGFAGGHFDVVGQQPAFETGRAGETLTRKLLNFAPSDLNIDRIQLSFSPILEPGTRSAKPLQKWEQQVCVMGAFVSSVE